MKVKALEKCYYDHEMKLPGEVFELHDVKTIGEDGEEVVISAEDQFSHKSMQSLEDAAPAEKKVKVRKHGANKGEREAIKTFNPNTSDNAKSKKDLKAAHGGEEGKLDEEDDAEGGDVL